MWKTMNKAQKIAFIFIILVILLFIYTIIWMWRDQNIRNSTPSYLSVENPCFSENSFTSDFQNPFYIPISSVEWNHKNIFQPIEYGTPYFIIDCDKVTEKGQPFLVFQYGFGVKATSDWIHLSYYLTFTDSFNNILTKKYINNSVLHQYLKGDTISVNLSFDKSEPLKSIPEKLYITEVVTYASNITQSFGASGRLGSNLSQNFTPILDKREIGSNLSPYLSIRERDKWKGIIRYQSSGRNSFPKHPDHLIGTSFEVRNEGTTDLIFLEIMIHFYDQNGNEIFQSTGALWEEFQNIFIAPGEKFGVNKSWKFNQDDYNKVTAYSLSLVSLKRRN